MGHYVYKHRLLFVCTNCYQLCWLLWTFLSPIASKKPVGAVAVMTGLTGATLTPSNGVVKQGEEEQIIIIMNLQGRFREPIPPLPPPLPIYKGVSGNQSLLLPPYKMNQGRWVTFTFDHSKGPSRNWIKEGRCVVLLC